MVHCSTVKDSRHYTGKECRLGSFFPSRKSSRKDYCASVDMQLKPDQIRRFKDLHKNHELDGYTEDEISELANGVANIYLTLYRTYQRVEREEKAKIDES
jgi:hypothetical protein